MSKGISCDRCETFEKRHATIPRALRDQDDAVEEAKRVSVYLHQPPKRTISHQKYSRYTAYLCEDCRADLREFIEDYEGGDGDE